MNYKINALLLLLIGMLTGNCIAHTDKNTRNLRGWDQEQEQESEFISLGWNGGTPGECEVGNAFRSCGRGATCWRTRQLRGSPLSPTWNGNGICVPNDQCLPGRVWARNSAVRPARMERECCNGATCRNNPLGVSYCVCLSSPRWW